jgi:hypothetical protein
MGLIGRVAGATLAVLLLIPAALGASGKTEARGTSGSGPRGNVQGAATEVATQASVTAYWLLEEGAANAEMLLERFYLPTSLSVLRWTDYRVGPDGVKLAGAGGYRVQRKEAILEERWNGAVLRGFLVRVSFTGEGDRPASDSTTLEVSFAYDTNHPPGRTAGGATPQPLQQALLKGIEAGGGTSGTARVLALEYRGRGRFQARVELR